MPLEFYCFRWQRFGNDVEDMSENNKSSQRIRMYLTYDPHSHMYVRKCKILGSKLIKFVSQRVK